LVGKVGRIRKNVRDFNYYKQTGNILGQSSMSGYDSYSENNAIFALEAFFYPFDKLALGIGLSTTKIAVLYPYTYPEKPHHMQILNDYFVVKYKLVYLNKGKTSYLYPIFNIGFSYALDGKTAKMEVEQLKFSSITSLDQDSGYFYGLGIGANLNHFIVEFMFTQAFYKFTGKSSMTYDYIPDDFEMNYYSTSELSINTFMFSIGYSFSL
jgi:hypothetical protein